MTLIVLASEVHERSMSDEVGRCLTLCSTNKKITTSNTNLPLPFNRNSIICLYVQGQTCSSVMLTPAMCMFLIHYIED